jgi:hypothetical protein
MYEEIISLVIHQQSLYPDLSKEFRTANLIPSPYSQWQDRNPTFPLAMQ